MARLVGWVLLISSFLWYALMPFAGDYEPPLWQIIGNPTALIAGAILIAGGKK
jgi:hypothetical protein